MKHPERIPEYLQHLVVACNRIHLALGQRTESEFLADFIPQDVCIRQIEILGEAAKRIRKEDDTFMERYELSELERIIGMRNRIAHQYEGVDFSLVWDVSTIIAPALREQVIELLTLMNLYVDPNSMSFE